MKNNRILDCFIRSSEDAIAFETLFKKTSIVFLIISLLLYILADFSIDYCFELGRRLTALDNEPELARFRLLCLNFLIPAISTSIMCVISFFSASYAHRKRIELSSFEK